MSLLRFGIIAAAHVVALGIVYLLSSLGNEEDGTITAGANGIVTWSNQEPNADRSIVDSSMGLPFDSRSGDLRGYNAGDEQAPMRIAQNAPSGRQRFEPTRPSTSGGKSESSDDELLQPVEKPAPTSVAQPNRSVPASPLPPFIEYTVARGDSLWGISTRYNISIAEIEAMNPGLKASSLQVGKKLRIPRGADAPVAKTPAASVAAPKVDGMTYTVKPGDTLSKIAANQGTTVSALKVANGLRSDIIRVGQKLTIPDAVKNPQLAARQWTGRKVVIKPGDTLGKIAALYDADVSEIIKLNNITNARLIRIGQTILIPDDDPGATASAPPKSSPPVSEQSAPPPTAPVVEESEPIIESDANLDVEEEDGLIIEEDPVEEPLIEIEE